MPTPKFGRGFVPKFGRQPEAQVAASDASAEVVTKPTARMTIGEQLRRPAVKAQAADASAEQNSLTVHAILEDRLKSGLARLDRENDPYLQNGKIATPAPVQAAPVTDQDVEIEVPVAAKPEAPVVHDSDGSLITAITSVDGIIEMYAYRGESWDLEDANGNPLALQVGDLAHRQWRDFTPEEQDALRARFPNAPEKPKSGPQSTGGVGRFADLIQAGLVTPDAPGVPGRPG